MTDTPMSSAVIESLSLAELKRQITAVRLRMEAIESQQRRRLVLAHLTWLESELERVHGITAPDRRSRV